jgi:hypothetical protein
MSVSLQVVSLGASVSSEMVQLVAYPLVIIFIFCFGGGHTALNDDPRRIAPNLTLGGFELALEQFNESNNSSRFIDLLLFRPDEFIKIQKCVVVGGS